MKLTNVKAMVAKSLTVGLLAGAFVLAAPAKADAQQFAVGIQFGSPNYGSYRDYYAQQRYDQYRQQQAYEAQEAYARQQAWAQHEAWERQQAYARYDNGYAYGDRDRDRRDRDDHRDGDHDGGRDRR